MIRLLYPYRRKTDEELMALVQGKIAFNLVRNLYREKDYLTTYETEILSTVQEAQEDNTFEKIDDELLFQAIVQSSGYQLLDVEAMRVVLNMPNWSSGMQNGDSMRVKFTLPIIFTLQ